MAQSSSIVLIISGPAGSGKTTLCERLCAEFPAVARMVTTTTRQPRPGERDGCDYHFIAEADFQNKLAAGEFMEWAKVHGRYYGSQRIHVLELLRAQRDILLNIDVQGACSFRGIAARDEDLRGRVHSLFILPASMEQLRERLRNRGTDDPAEIERRLRNAEAEIQQAASFDHRIISSTREADYSALRDLYLDLKNGRKGML